MAYTTLKLTVADHVAHVQLTRPEALNTMNKEFWDEIPAAFAEIDADQSVRAVVISSTGKHFTAGLDLNWAGTSLGNKVEDAGRAREAFRRHVKHLQETFSAIDRCRVPVVAAIQGGCIGGALDLAAACDLRVASADAFFTVQEIHIGMAADLGVLQRLPKIVPPAVAREMAYTGERLGAERALAVGLVNAVRPDAAAALSHSMQMAASIAAKSPLAVAGSKLAINYAVDHPTADALQQMTLLQSAIFDIDEMAVAIQAWKAKEAGSFDALAPVSAV
jgi:enoyl-CoA hydratase